MSKPMLMGSAAVAAAFSLWAIGAAPAQKGGSGLDGIGSRKMGDDLVKVSLVTGPGHLGLVFDIEPGWHIYWKNPGDSGAPPSWTFTLPEGATLGEAQWPTPMRHEGSGDILDYVYEGQVVILFPYEPARSGVGAEGVSAEVDWLVCKDVCLPGSGKAAPATQLDSRAQSGLIDASRARIPAPESRAQTMHRATFFDGRLTIHVPGAKHLVFFPDPSDALVKPVDAFHEGKADGDRISLRYTHESQNAAVISGVLEVHRLDGAQAFVVVSIPGPAAVGVADTPSGSR